MLIYIKKTFRPQVQPMVRQVSTPEPTPQATPRALSPGTPSPAYTPLPSPPPEASPRVVERVELPQELPVAPPTAVMVPQQVYEPDSEPESSASYDIQAELNRLAGMGNSFDILSFSNEIYLYVFKCAFPFYLLSCFDLGKTFSSNICCKIYLKYFNESTCFALFIYSLPEKKIHFQTSSAQMWPPVRPAVMM